MAEGVTLPYIAKLTNVPHSTLRFWARTEGWKTCGRGPYGAKLYDPYEVMPRVKAHPEAQEVFARAGVAA